MSTHPGARTSPAASISRRPRPSTSPIAVIRPPSIPTSPDRGGAPVPSMTVALRTTRSCMRALLIHQRLVHELTQLRPERMRARRQQLGEEHADDLLARIDPE